MAKQSIVITMLLAACLLVLSACGGGEPNRSQPNKENHLSSAAGSEEEEQPETEFKVVTHAFGEKEIPANPQAIASINLEDMLLALDVPLALASPVGRQDYLNETLERKGTEVVPLGESINFEALLQAEPDLIIASRIFDQGEFEQLDKIAPTIAFDRTDWRSSIVQVAEALDRKEQAETILARHAQQIEEAREQIEEWIGPNRTAAFLRVQEKDLRLFFPRIESDPNPYAGYVSIAYEGLNFQPDLIALELQKDNPDRQNAPISFEILPELTADYLFIVALSADGSDEALQKTYDELQEWQSSAVWAAIPAVQQDQVYVLNMKNWLIDGPHAEKLKINELLEALRP